MVVLACGAGDVWDLVKATIGWELGESPVLLPFEDDENDVHGEIMLFTGVAEDRVAFSFKEDASCFLLVLDFT